LSADIDPLTGLGTETEALEDCLVWQVLPWLDQTADKLMTHGAIPWVSSSWCLRPIIAGKFFTLNRYFIVVRIWSFSLLVCAIIVAFAFLRLDVPLALYFWNVGHLRSPLNTAFGSRLILSAEAAVILFTVVARLVRGRIPVLIETLAMACLVSMCAYVVNDHILKIFFGVLNPADVVGGAGHRFNFWMGSEGSSFPSGHMVLAGAFAGFFMRLYKASTWFFSALLLIAAGLLLVGDWHFLSDIIAGAFLGTSAGMLAGEGWAAHSAR
jgi:membrane-associated phospholipid phosphatase